MLVGWVGSKTVVGRRWLLSHLKELLFHLQYNEHKTGVKGIDRIKKGYVACRGCQWASLNNWQNALNGESQFRMAA